MSSKAFGVFTCGAVDNIDHNPSARTAKDSFHGTAISLRQFPISDTPGYERIKVQHKVERRSKISPLPLSYSLVPSKTSTFDPIVPKRCGVFSPDENILKRNKEKEFQWLSKVSAQWKETPDEYNDLSWAAHHASIPPQQSFIPSNI